MGPIHKSLAAAAAAAAVITTSIPANAQLVARDEFDEISINSQNPLGLGTGLTDIFGLHVSPVAGTTVTAQQGALNDVPVPAAILPARALLMRPSSDRPNL